MIYLDTSVLLAVLLAEDQSPAPTLWERSDLISSRLAEYEVWNRLHARRVGVTLRDAAVDLFNRIDLMELAPTTLARALEPFPQRVKTLDALHLATADFLRGQGHEIELATYDKRLAAAATAIGIALLDFG